MKRTNASHDLDIPTEQLPSWMRRARQSVDWGILLVFLFSLIASWGFIVHDDLPHTNAGENHVYAASEYAQAFKQGVLYPRWSASSMGGYGAPIYNFYPPALSYISALIDVLFVDDPVVAMRIVLVSAFVLAGSMCYVLVLRVAGSMTALLASILYIFSPYINLTAPHLLGDYQSVLLFALYPMALWNLNRLLTFRNPFDLALGAMIYAGVILVDPRVLGVVVVLSLPMLIWWRWQSYESILRFLGSVTRLLIALFLGLGLSAFFWMPALLEHHQTAWIAQSSATADAHLTWLELLSFGRMIDVQEMNPSPYFNLGWGLIFALLVSLTLVFKRKWTVRKRQRWVWHLLYLGLGVGLLIGVMAFSPQAVWMLAPIVLCLTLGASGLSLWRDELPPLLQSVFIPIILMIVLMLNITAWTGTRAPAPFGATDDYARIQHELRGYGNAVLPPDAPIPTHIDANYMINQTLIDGYHSGNPIRIPNLRLSGEKMANFVYANSHTDRYLVEAREAVTFDILRAYDVGWEAWLDGETVELKPNPANGLMQVLIPTVMSGQLDIRYTSTTPRLWGWLIVGGVLVILAIQTAGRMLRYVTHEQDDDLDYLRDTDARLMTVFGVGFVMIVLLHALPSTTHTLHARSGYQLDHFTGLFLRSESGLEVFGYDYYPPTTNYQEGDRLEFDLAWRTVQPQSEDYQLRVSIWSEDYFKRWHYQVFDTIGQYPTSRWEVDYYVLDPIQISPQDLPAGTYRIGLEVLLCAEQCLLDSREVFWDIDGVFIGSLVFLPFTVTVD